MAQLLSHLAQRHVVALLCLRAPDEAPVDDTLRQACALVEEINLGATHASGAGSQYSRLSIWAWLLRGRPLWALDRFSPAYLARVQMLIDTWHPDVIHIEYHIMGQYLSALRGTSQPRVLTLYDPGASTARDNWRAALTPGRLMPYLDLQAWFRFERAILRRVQAVIVFTERDRQTIQRLSRATPVIRIPIATEVPAQALDPLGSEPTSLVFVGNFTHPPNVDAAMCLVETIFPRVRRVFPQAVLYLVGDQPPPALTAIADEHVVVTGRVPDVTPYLDRAAVVVAPIRLGGGMRVKVLEALAAGKALVASPLATAGLDLISGEQALVTDGSGAFVEAIITLLGDPLQRSALAGRARSWALDHLTWTTSIDTYDKLYRDVLGEQ